jgi:tRNA nucleotidyltransferase (CCA-adding enzyme)
MQADQQLEKAKAIVVRLLAAGATDCMLVGGFVRDHLMGAESKDIDIEVYGIGYDQIVETLAPHHRVCLVGRSFGIVKVDHEIDINIPRRESKTGVGHRGFSVHPDPTMTPREAASRRDFTLNSMGMTFDGKIFDPFDGRKDLRDGILRATGDAFRDDPLRVLRGMQFASRFGFDMDEQTLSVCKGMVDEFDALSKERVWEEWHKWAAKGRHPSKGLQLLERTGWIANFPILQAMVPVPQDPAWHPEGNVFVHTCHACDAAVEIADRENLDAAQRMILLFASLCHDFGKTTTTTRNERGRWIARKHSEAGVPQARRFLENMQAPGWLVDTVLPLVAEHMTHAAHSKNKPSPKVVRRLAMRLAPATIRMWSALCEADASGRPPLPKRNPVTTWVSVADGLTLQDDKPQPVLMGRHLIPFGYRPGPDLGVILKNAFEAQLDGDIKHVDEGIQWARSSFPLEQHLANHDNETGSRGG